LSSPELDVQFPAKCRVLFQPSRYKNLRGGRGSSKSWSVARAALIKGTQKALRVLCAREVQRSIRDSVYRLLCDQIEALGLQAYYEVLQTEIRGREGTSAAGTLFVFSGLSDQTADSLKSFEGINLCWVEEAQVVSNRSWGLLIPTIRAPGSEIWLTWNPDLDTDPTWVRFEVNTPPDCITVEMNYRDNPWFPPELEQERLHMQRTDPVGYENVWEGKPRAAIEGAIYAPEMTHLAMSGRVRNVPADPLLKTHTIWDLGFNDSTAIIFAQRQQSELRVVDYLEDSHRTLIEYANQIKDRGYNLGEAWLPWDGAEERFQLTDAKTSPEAILKKAGLKARIVPKVDVETGIKKARLIFPRCYFDAARTARLRECLKRYRRAVPVSTDEPAKPLHDEFSHGADAFRYLGVVADKLTNDDVGQRKIVHDFRGYV
jgi:phage terminase large subunit